ncbi:MAG TPA: DMT family transporter [Candidatus Thermoplasmatota archaeon]|nr:DMT family transporter [Candidatus Thermoplasmatota archaeon]
MANAKHPLTLLGVQLLFGLFPVAAKKVFLDLDPFPVLALRLGGAAFFLLILHLFLVKDAIPIRTEWRRVLLLSMLGVVLNMGLFILGVRLTTAVNAVLVITTIPVFTYGLAVVMGKERLGPQRAIGIAVALSGVVYLIGSSYQVSPRGALGDFLVMLNCFCYSAFLVLARPMTQRYDPLSLTTWMFVIGAVVFVPLGLWFGLRGQLADASTGTLGWVLYIILGATVVTYVLSARVLRHVPASTVAIFTYVQPIFTAIAAYFLLGANLQWKVLPAAVLVFAGVWLVAMRQPKVLEGQTVVD